ncbi:Transcription initiation factor TFIID subunit 10 [Glugoides intestinalis]
MNDSEFNEFKDKLSSYTPMIPDSVIDAYCETCGVETLDKDVKKTISLMSHKFLTDIAVASFQYHKIFSKAAQKDKRFGREKKLTLQMQDVEKALKDMEIDISRPSYFL